MYDSTPTKTLMLTALPPAGAGLLVLGHPTNPIIVTLFVTAILFSLLLSLTYMLRFAINRKRIKRIVTR